VEEKPSYEVLGHLVFFVGITLRYYIEIYPVEWDNFLRAEHSNVFLKRPLSLFGEYSSCLKGGIFLYFFWLPFLSTSW
jgi:hypothetical protein